IGGLAVVICFFQPWVSSYSDKYSGADLGGNIWLVLLAGIVIVGSAHYYNSPGQLSKLKIIVRSAAGLALLLVVIKRAELRLYYKIEYGISGTIGGLVLAFY